MSTHPLHEPAIHVASAEPVGVPSVDPVASSRWLSRMPAESPWLHEEVGVRMAERLGWIQQPPRSWLDWNPALGGWNASRLVAERYKKSEYFLPSPIYLKGRSAPNKEFSFWEKIRSPFALGESSKIIPAGGRVDMVWANMLLHAADRPRDLMQKWFQLLNVNGFLMFSGLGPDSLGELRLVYQKMGWHDPTHALTDMHDWGDMLVASGFADPVMDTERVVLTYSNAEHLLSDLRSLGRNLSTQRKRTLCSRAWRNQVIHALELHGPRTADGRLLLTFEVIYGHAYRGVARYAVAPETRLSMTDMKELLHSGKRLR